MSARATGLWSARHEKTLVARGAGLRAGADLFSLPAVRSRVRDSVGPAQPAFAARLSVRGFAGGRALAAVGPVHVLRAAGVGQYSSGHAVSNHAVSGGDGPGFRARHAAPLAVLERGAARGAG